MNHLSPNRLPLWVLFALTLIAVTTLRDATLEVETSSVQGKTTLPYAEVAVVQIGR